MQVAHPDAAAVGSDGGADRWAAASVEIAQAVAAPKKTIPISPRNGEVSEKAGSGSRDDGLSGPGEDRSEPPERRTVPEGLSWRPMVVYSRVPEGQKTNSGLPRLPSLAGRDGTGGVTLHKVNRSWVGSLTLLAWMLLPLVLHAKPKALFYYVPVEDAWQSLLPMPGKFPSLLPRGSPRTVKVKLQEQWKKESADWPPNIKFH